MKRRGFLKLAGGAIGAVVAAPVLAKLPQAEAAGRVIKEIDFFEVSLMPNPRFIRGSVSFQAPGHDKIIIEGCNNPEFNGEYIGVDLANGPDQTHYVKWDSVIGGFRFYE